MVPHIRIEEKLRELADATEQVFAVTAVPDDKKGERIIVIHSLPAAKLTAVLEKLSQCDLPALWKPKANQFVHVDSIPTLGTGKMDLREIKALATSLAADVEAEAQAGYVRWNPGGVVLPKDLIGMPRHVGPYCPMADRSRCADCHATAPFLRHFRIPNHN